MVVVGGSLGARTVNEAMLASLAKILEAGASVLWQTGKLYADRCTEASKAIVEKYGADRVQVTPFVGRMDLVYRGADLMVSRAGASTISEIQLTGVPAILVPSPNVAEDHQRKNAQALASRDAAVMILDKDCVTTLGSEVTALLSDPARRKALGANALKMALPAADTKILTHLESLLK